VSGEVTKIWKLDSPAMCRDFLKSLRWMENGEERRITWLGTASGKQIPIDEASDEQVMQIANDLSAGMPTVNK
jgi:hypothetical protein